MLAYSTQPCCGYDISFHCTHLLKDLATSKLSHDLLIHKKGDTVFF